MKFERIDSRKVWQGKIATVRVDCFRHDDGEVVEREVAAHPGASVIVAHDGESVYLAEQPREVVGAEALLELPAGKIDRGRPPEQTAARELVEEIGRRAGHLEQPGHGLRVARVQRRDVPPVSWPPTSPRTRPGATRRSGSR